MVGVWRVIGEIVEGDKGGGEDGERKLEERREVERMGI